ncbi:hypothetical protein BBJ29_007068 [Phytophthora kernoviae]|uniref:RxLR effector protein n=1 Tax=Phytophthora kernoviae TaxID=325452 RepID=A0A3F2RHC8_9STRA|nr:hypothetical protein BBJ29_007068 [Phytophthora kernoviae]RLN57049.1 hypothetical protein BBP00_00007705 [Phytophthora kernoviae]
MAKKDEPKKTKEQGERTPLHDNPLRRLALRAKQNYTMRVGYVVLAIAATLLATSNALPAASEVAQKKTFTITSPDSNDTLKGVSIQDDGAKFIILYGDNNKAAQSDSTDESGVGDGSSYEDDSDSGPEERALPVDAEAVEKMTKTTSQKKYNSFMNKFL